MGAGGRRKGGILRIVLPWLLVLVATGAGAALLRTPPTVPKSAPQRILPVVGVAELVPQDVRVSVEAFGTVVAAREVRIQPQVTGEVVTLNPKLVPGGLIESGEILFEVEAADYQIAVAEAEAEFKSTGYQIEQLRAGVDVLRSRLRQATADLDYLTWNAQRLGRLSEGEQAGASETREAETQVESQRAAVAAFRAQIVEGERAIDRANAQRDVAKARREMAELALARTHVVTPFDAVVLTESVELGQLVAAQSTVATLAATEEFWIEASLPAGYLKDIRFADESDAEPSEVNVILATGQTTLQREGLALRPLGRLDPRGRMARILVAVPDPLDLMGSGRRGERGIILGSYVRLAIDAGVMEGVYTIPRYALRENGRVWVRDANGELAIRDVNIVWRRQDDVLVRNGFQTGDALVTTHLASVVPGTPLDVRNLQDTADRAADPGGS